MSFARIFSAQPSIPRAHIVSVESDISRGLHAFTIVGLPDKAVEEARDRVASAIKNSGFTSPKSTNKKIVVSLAPAALKKEGPAFDLAVALSYLVSAGDVSFETEGKIFAGELSLDGTLQAIHGALPIALAAREAGFAEVYVPKENAAESALVSGVTVYGVGTLSELIRHLESKEATAKIVATPHEIPPLLESEDGLAFEDIRGQEHAKRGLEIAAAGRHNIALYGPPGTGKTLLARALASILPALEESAMMEVTAIHSIAGTLAAPIVQRPPFRSPHHTASYASLIGGGTIPKPGEVTLAHQGVLFADEFPEFKRDVINALRQPMEDGVVSVSRVRGTHTFPANFMLVAALNPCPCGCFGSARCTCLPVAIERYKRKISGPIADRIDMWIQVGEVPLETLSLERKSKRRETDEARERITRARKMQADRFKEEAALSTNSDMGPKTIGTYARLSKKAESTAMAAATRLNLSPRGYHRTIKLARTIADLAHSEDIQEEHMLEALQYRAREM
jgi:magnesium chelatase family protein